MRHSAMFLGALFVVAISLGLPALAFHDDGVAHCNGCHTMHNSPDNPADSADGNSFLLKQSTSTDMCLTCHATRLGNSWGAALDAPGTLVGGGNFIFLTEDNLNDGHAGSLEENWIPGHQAGHSIISDDRTLAPDPVNEFGPGGSYPAENLTCTSCHDPHGQGAHFRLLYGDDFPTSKSNGYFFDYTAAAPDAVESGFGQETNANHTAFRAGMSEWCGACHGDYHNTDYPNTLKHPSGEVLGAIIAANYNKYEGSGDYTGLKGDAYLAMVPFEDPAAATDSTEGATGTTSKVMCLSCHRAHASSGPNSGRWDFNLTIWDDEGVESGSYIIPNPYDATAGGHQRSLCNKCHAKDPVL
ncbi:MAG: hypothetical protein JSV80_11315 [Acidobacteriota bacterium]|nr:MAG: hypothetical protein JSV80_11315 [Acidobacteriota bacterium]